MVECVWVTVRRRCAARSPELIRLLCQMPSRLLKSPSLVTIGLSVGYKTRPAISWHHPFVIGWSKYSLGLPSAPLHYGLTWPVGIPTVFQTPVTFPLHSPNRCGCARGLWKSLDAFTAQLFLWRPYYGWIFMKISKSWKFHLAHIDGCHYNILHMSWEPLLWYIQKHFGDWMVRIWSQVFIRFVSEKSSLKWAPGLLWGGVKVPCDQSVVFKLAALQCWTRGQ